MRMRTEPLSHVTAPDGELLRTGHPQCIRRDSFIIRYKSRCFSQTVLVLYFHLSLFFIVLCYYLLLYLLGHFLLLFYSIRILLSPGPTS